MRVRNEIRRLYRRQYIWQELHRTFKRSAVAENPGEDKRAFDATVS